MKNKDLKQDEFQSDDEDDGSRVIEMGKELSVYGTVNVTKDKKSAQKQAQSAKKWLDDQTRGRKSSASW